MKIVEEFLSVKLIDYGPTYQNYGPDYVTAVSGLLTVKNRDFFEKVQKMNEEKVRNFHLNSTRKGHASLLTTPVIYLWITGSRFIDLYFSSHTFGSYLIASSRRIGVSIDDFLIPEAINNSRYKSRYERIVAQLFEIYKEISKEYGLDYARNILPIAFHTHGLFAYPLQTILTLINRTQKSDVPKELILVSKNIREILEKVFPILYESSMLSSLTGYPFPNIFERDTISEEEGIWVVHLGNSDSVLENIKRGDWFSASRIGMTEIILEVVDSISLACYNELKRHRTINLRVESIYDAINRYLKNNDESNIHVPPRISKELGKRYIEAFNEALSFYDEVKDEVGKQNALYIIPHALKLKVKFVLSGYNLVAPFGFIGVRSCIKAHYEIRALADKISSRICEELPELCNYIGPKCKIGYCPEEHPCKRFYTNFS